MAELLNVLMYEWLNECQPGRRFKAAHNFPRRGGYAKLWVVNTKRNYNRFTCPSSGGTIYHSLHQIINDKCS
jgi:hypothetical protein